MSKAAAKPVVAPRALRGCFLCKRVDDPNGPRLPGSALKLLNGQLEYCCPNCQPSMRWWDGVRRER